MPSQTDNVEILDAVRRAKYFGLCLRRVWAIAATLPDREKSLPTLIPAVNTFPVPNHTRQHHEHEQCTFDFCEHSRIDFTSVMQYHEKCDGSCERFTFQLNLLEDRVRKGTSTAWGLDNNISLLDNSQPYMAVSHVWADGTGVGTWGPGNVNKCLYVFLSNIARYFQCEGCWWDTISIPVDKEARREALNDIHSNYANARITLVHDLYLREWEWVNAETACFAIVMSPWYSRGWTSLELAKSHKVKILFKARNDGYVIKDLDVDILAEVPPYSRHHTAAESIRKLRSASIQSFGDLLAILGPRDTSKPRDVPIISGLLAGVDVSGGLSQQDIYQRILRKLGKVAQGHLFHNSATMSAPGFSWCPTNILDTPLAEPDSALLKLQENGDLEGIWRVYPVNSVKPGDFIWKGTHPLTQVSIESALSEEARNQHLLLVESEHLRSRALLVRFARQEKETTTMLCCRFVGPVYFRSALGKHNGAPGEHKITFGECYGEQDFRIANVRIGSVGGMREPSWPAWLYVSSVKVYKPTKRASSLEDAVVPLPGTLTSKSQYHLDEDYSFDIKPDDLKAIVYFANDESKSSLLRYNELHIPKNIRSGQPDNMVLHFITDDSHGITSLRHDRDEKTSIPHVSEGLSSRLPDEITAFFYGNEDIIQDVKTWLRGNLDIGAGDVVPLVIDQDGMRKVESDDIQAIGLLANGLLLALEHGYDSIAEKFLLHKMNLASVEKTNAEGERAIHIAAKKGSIKIAELLVENNAELDTKEEGMDRTALHLAVKNGHNGIAQLLLSHGADPNITDLDGQTVLHYAAMESNDVVVASLLGHARARGGKIDGKIKTTTLARPDMQDGEKHTALMIAARSDNWSIVDMLLRAHADPNLQDKRQYTALHYAVKHGSLNILDSLLSFGADPNIPDSGERTALHLAMTRLQPNISIPFYKMEQNRDSWWPKTYPQRREPHLMARSGEFGGRETKFQRRIGELMVREKFVFELLEHGASLYMADEEGRTALHWAILKNREDIVDILIKCDRPPAREIKDAEGRTPLQLAAEKGYASLVEALLRAGFNPNTWDKMGRTPLLLAVGGGHSMAVNALLNARADPNLVDIVGRTVLSTAAQNGCGVVVKELLTTQWAMRNLNKRDTMGRTALLLAAEAGDSISVDLLLEAGADPNLADLHERTALSIAAQNGRGNIVKELLAAPGTRPDLNKRDSAGRTALIHASENGHDAIVENLLSHGAKSSIAGYDGKTAWQKAMDKGYVSIVRKLLSKSHAPIPDGKHRMALMQAAEHGFESIVNLLLEREEVNAKIHEWMGQEVLLFAAEKGCDGIVEQLLKTNVNRNSADPTGRTAMILAAANGNTAIVELLLSEGADSTVRDSNNRTALHHAVWGGHDDVVGTLLKRGDDLNVLDNHGQSALHLAAERASQKVVEQLLWKGADTHAKSTNGQTALHFAAWGGSYEVVMLLRKNGADPFARDNLGNKPWQVAAEKGHESIVEVLIKEEEGSVKDECIMKKKSLIFAAQMGYRVIVSVLLEKGAESGVRDQDGFTPLHWAAMQGEKTMVELLLNKGKASIDALNNLWQTPLAHGVLNGRAAVVEMLLQSGANPNMPDKEGQTVLHHAAQRGNWEIVQILINYKTDPHLRDCQWRKAWQVAAENGYHQIVRFLWEKEVGLNPGSRKMEGLFLQMAERGLVLMVELLLEIGVNKDATDRFGRAAIGLAAEHGKDEVLELLISKGANASVPDCRLQTPLLWAAKTGNIGIVNLLLDKTASVSSNEVCRVPPSNREYSAPDNITIGLIEKDNNRAKIVNHSDAEGRTALLVAVEQENNEMVKLLLDKGCPDIDINTPDMTGRTALHLAAEKGDHKLIRLLLDNGAKLDLPDKLERTALLLAAEQGDNLAVKILIENSPGVVDKPDLHKRTALQVATEAGNKDMIQELLAKGAQVDLPDQFGRTALLLAVENGNNDIVDLLLRNGASQRHLDLAQRTPLLLAVSNGDKVLVETLLKHGANLEDEKYCLKLLQLAQQSGSQDVMSLVSSNIDFKKLGSALGI